MLDILFQNVTVIDGTGAGAFSADVGVYDGKISVNPPDAAAKRVIDGSGLHLTPGFIDFHSHGDAVLGRDYGNLCKISQGVTTQVGGQCGSSMFPISKERYSEIKNVLSVICSQYYDELEQWSSFKTYVEQASKLPSALNTKLLTGHSNLRVAVMGMENRKPTRQEMERMKALLRETMENGSLGLSSGLIYAPSCYAEPEELIELAGVAAEYGGIYTSHMRNESCDVCRSIEETLRVGREAGLPVAISHHKICGKKNWGLSEKTMQMIADARAAGQMVTIDQYPYLASMTHLKMCIPPRYFSQGPAALAESLKDADVRKTITREILDPQTDFENWYLSCGGWENVFISSLPETPEFVGMTVLEAAEKMGAEPFDAYFELLLRNNTVGNAIYHCMCDDDLQRIISGPDSTVGSDGICRSMVEVGHPRAWGSFPHAICYFCKEKKVLSLEAMIHKITQFAAQRAMIRNKGVVADGYDADLVLFHYDALQDRADYVHSNTKTDGIAYVVVNGKIVYEGGALTGEYPGKILLHNR